MRICLKSIGQIFLRLERLCQRRPGAPKEERRHNRDQDEDHGGEEDRAIDAVSRADQVNGVVVLPLGKLRGC